MKISTRINSRVTSIQVKNSVIALHYIYTTGQMPPTANSIRNHALDACHGIIAKWDGTGKGLSGHITDTLLADVIDTDDSKDYLAIIQELEE